MRVFEAGVPNLQRFGIARVAALGTAFALSTAILLRYYGRMWLAQDDGYYAHIADRILGGEVLHRDVQALHPGYVYFVDALALRLFGSDLVSLRYPLVAIGVAEAGLVAAMFLRRSAIAAAAGAVAFTSLSYVLFPTPSVHWYCLFLLVAIVAALRWIPQNSPWRPIVSGFLVGALGLFRQLTGAFVGIGVVAYLLAEPVPAADPARQATPAASKLAARVVIGASAAVIAAYVVAKSSMLALLLFGMWAPLLLAMTCYHASRGVAETLRLLVRLALGASLAAAPLLVYHIVTGSLRDWFKDSVVSAVALSDLDYVKFKRYAQMLAQAALQIVRPGDMTAWVNGVFWVSVMLGPAVVGMTLLWALARRRAGSWPHPLPFLAVFYAPVAVHYEAPAYVLFVAAPIIVGLLWIVTERWGPHGGAAPRGIVAGAVFGVGFLSLVALRYQAGQPVNVVRQYSAAVAGVRGNVDRARGIDRVSLGIGRSDSATYAELLDLIRRETQPGDAILAVPGGAELHFLSARRNPLPYPYVVYGVMDERSLARALDTLRRDPPKLVFHVPSFSYNTPYTDRLMQDVRSRYTPLANVREFVVYRLDASP